MGTIYDPYTYMRLYWQGSIDNEILIYSGGDDYVVGVRATDSIGNTSDQILTVTIKT